MPLSITLTNSHQTYTSGSTIKGTIEFTSSTPTHLQDIRILFTGISKSKISKRKGAGAPSATYRAKCILFERERILFTANGGVLPPGEYKYPFEFTFPQHVSEGRKWAEKVPFRSDASQPLPASFSFEGRDEKSNIIANIEYKIEAQVTRAQPGLFSTRAPLFKEEMKLDFLPDYAISDGHENDEHPPPPRKKGRSLSLQEKMQGWLLPSQLPRFSFTATFSYPTRVIQGLPLNCVLEIMPHMEDSSVVSEPEIILQSINIYVISQTSARAAPSLMGSLSAEIERNVEILSKTSLHLPVSGKMNLNKIRGPLTLRHTEVSFRTFNVARTYRLCAEMLFDCAGKRNLSKVSGEEFEVVSGDIGIGNSGKKVEEMNLERAQAVAGEEALPAYTPFAPVSFRQLNITGTTMDHPKRRLSATPSMRATAHLHRTQRSILSAATSVYERHPTVI
ncbi:hypothetical protein BDW69DRAFT_200438 [Aspergillus filifer]